MYQNIIKYNKLFTQNCIYLINAKNQHLGRFATKISSILENKNNLYSENFYLCVLNINNILITGKKKNNFIYYASSQRPGNLKKHPYIAFQRKLPNKVIEFALKRMIAKNTSNTQKLSNLLCIPNELQVSILKNLNIFKVLE